MAQIDRADRIFLFLNVFLLMVVAFIPFPTRLVAEHIQDDGATAAAVSYGITLTATAVMFNLVWFYASGGGGRLLRPDHDPAAVKGITRSYRPAPWIYLAMTLVALVAPVAGRAALRGLRGLLDDRELVVRQVPDGGLTPVATSPRRSRTP